MSGLFRLTHRLEPGHNRGRENLRLASRGPRYSLRLFNSTKKSRTMGYPRTHPSGPSSDSTSIDFATLPVSRISIPIECSPVKSPKLSFDILTNKTTSSMICCKWNMPESGYSRTSPVFLIWKLVLENIYVTFHVLSSFPHLKTSSNLQSMYISYSIKYFRSLTWKLVLKNVYVTFYSLSSFPYSKTSFEACVSLIPCLFSFPRLKTSSEACMSLIPCFIFFS